MRYKPVVCRGKEVKSEVIKVDLDRSKVVEGARYDGNRPQSVRNEHGVNTNVLCQIRGPGGHEGK